MRTLNSVSEFQTEAANAVFYKAAGDFRYVAAPHKRMERSR